MMHIFFIWRQKTHPKLDNVTLFLIIPGFFLLNLHPSHCCSGVSVQEYCWNTTSDILKQCNWSICIKKALACILMISVLLQRYSSLICISDKKTSNTLVTKIIPASTLQLCRVIVDILLKMNTEQLKEEIKQHCHELQIHSLKCHKWRAVISQNKLLKDIKLLNKHK